MSKDWVVRYNNRLLQLERQSQHGAPAQSRVLVRENEAGNVASHYRGQSLRFRELKAASTALSEARGAAPSPAPHPPSRHLPPPPNHPWRLGFQRRNTPTFSVVGIKCSLVGLGSSVFALMIFAAGCGGGNGFAPAPALSCSPASQAVSVGASANFSAANGSGAYAWAAPNGSPASGSGAAFATTYSAAGTDMVTVTSGSNSASCSVTVNAAPQPPVVTSPLTATGTTGSSFSYTITATNSPTSFGAIGLPAGVSVNTSSGLISGTPTASGTSNVAISATNAAGTGTATLALTVNAAPPPPVITSSLTATGTVGSSFSYTITATNSPTSFGATGLPAGLSVNTSSGLISGTPTTAGASNVAISATNAAGTGSATLALTVNAAPQPPVITSPLTATATVGSSFSYTITATNSPTSFGATGLPAGLGVNTSSGLISGTPQAAATSNVTISATNGAGTGSATLVLTIGPQLIISSVSVSPKRAAVVATTQTAQFSATVSGDPTNSVTWSVDGVPGGNTTVGTISVAGLYTPPAAAGTHTVVATSTVDTTKSDSATIAATDLLGVVTYHNNLARDGTNLQEYALTTSSVNTATFGKLFSCPVDGAAYTQPLWVPSLSIGGQMRNALFVATEHDSAYAFDADANPCSQLWQANLLDAAHGGTAGEIPVPYTDVGQGSTDIQPEIGVTGTPVIDPTSGTLYVVSKSEGPTGTFHQRLHALDLATGNEKFGGPVNITASVPGSGDGSVGGVLTFNVQTENQRGALALVNGIVYIVWASHGDTDPYHGWLIGYNVTTLAQVAVFNTNPDGSRAGIWMAGGAPAADVSGNLYFSSGNGTFDGNSATAPNHDFGDTVMKVGTSSGLILNDWFTPFNQADLSINDQDLGSGGALLLPDQTSGPAHLLVTGGKEGRLYLLNRDAMGHYCATCTTTDTNAVESFLATVIFGTPAFWQNKLYLGGVNDNIKLFTFDPTNPSPLSTTASSQSPTSFPFPGAIPSVSAQGTSGGVLWVIDSSQYGVPSVYGSGPAVLHAYDAANLANELWNSSQAASNRDTAGNAVKFTVPTVANGKVYIGTRTEIDVYGLLPN